MPSLGNKNGTETHGSSHGSSPAAPASLGSPALQFLQYLLRELLQPANYVIALGIGLLIHLLQGLSPLTSAVPYIVPVVVQALSKAYVKFSNRHLNLLLSLPGRRRDPAFLMDWGGRIALATGNTERFLEENGITRLDGLLEAEGAGKILRCVEAGLDACEPVDAYSPPLEKWYRVTTGRSPDGKMVLVWCEDITTRKELDAGLSRIRDFSEGIITDLDDLIEQNDSFSRLARLMLELGYGGVFITEVDEKGLSGHVYAPPAGKQEGEQVGDLRVSELIAIDRTSDAPIWISRREGRLSYDELGAGRGSSDIDSPEEFRRRYPFDERVEAFLGEPVRSFVNYHEGDVSIIAFNLGRPITSGDLLAMEVLANSARSVSSLLNLASENDQKFLQSVTGLCSAAEYSDEITGLHILRVNEYSKFLAGKLGMALRGQTHIGQVAAMHDIGKVAIPHLIKLDRAFTPEERRDMEMHTIYGAQIIEKMMTCCNATEPRLAMAYEIALNHHQQWAGGGYPPVINSEGRRCSLTSKMRSDYDELRPARRNEIPLTARIVSMADTYDALRSARQYKPAKRHEDTVEIMRKDDRSGIRGEDRFGPDLMEIFAAHHQKFDEIFEEMQE